MVSQKNISNISTKIEAYLKNKGWQIKKRVEGLASLWFNSKDQEQFTLLVPLDENLGDFKIKITELVGILSKFENRPLNDILASFENTSELAKVTSELAKNLNREILDIRISSIAEDKNEVSAQKIGSVLKSLQDLVDQIGQAISPTNDFKNELELSLIDTFKGSFALRLASVKVNKNYKQLTLWEQEPKPIIEIALQDLLAMFKATEEGNETLLEDKISELHNKTSRKLKSLLANFLELSSDIYIYIGVLQIQKKENLLNFL